VDTEYKRVLGGRYEVGEPLGHGGMAEVRRGYDRKLARNVAIKCLAPGAVVGERDRLRFEQEARCAAAISHPNVAAIYDVGIDGHTPYIVMECLPGATLADEVERGPIATPRATEVVQQLLAALEAAHAHDVLHRDIKAANVLFTSEGRVKLTDFGIARATDGDDLTETGTVVGTPSYLAPERIAGEPATVRSDIYSAGVVAYEVFTGEKPFRADTPVALAYAILHTPATPVREHRPEIDPALDAAVMRAIAPVPEDRFPTARAFADALDAPAPDLDETLPFAAVGEPTAVMPAVVSSAPAPRPNRFRRWVVPVAAVAILAALVLGGLSLRNRDPASEPSSPSPTTVVLPAGLQEPFDALQQSVEP
jgi:serine/threonine protein kinase